MYIQILYNNWKEKNQRTTNLFVLDFQRKIIRTIIIPKVKQDVQVTNEFKDFWILTFSFACSNLQTITRDSRNNNRQRTTFVTCVILVHSQEGPPIAH